MDIVHGGPVWTRRRALGMGAKLTGGLIAAASLSNSALAYDGDSDSDDAAPSKDVQHTIEDIIDAQGSVSNGIFSIDIDRNDMDNITLHGVPIKPSFQINGTLTFQSQGGSNVMMNSDMALKASEIDHFIDQLLSHNVVFQAEHQHMYDFEPDVWFIHFRAMGNAAAVAHGVKAALNVTSTPFPQAPPSNPTTPLPADKIGQILGADPQIQSDGVVLYDLPRREPIWLGGVRVNPYLNVETNIAFQPLGGGSHAAAVPDFGMIASEINTVVMTMRRQGWDIGCLYNQETDEKPQLYFSHQFRTGDPIELAKEIRNGLNHMNLKFK